MNIPNLLTLLRILSIPLFIIFLINDHFGAALLIFILAGISDGLDGLIARVYNQKTVLGAYLDPIADKALICSALIVLTSLRMVPNWLTVIIVSRDILIVVGIMVFFFTSHKVTINPSLPSKITTCLQLFTIFVFLLDGYSYTFHDTLLSLFIWATAGSTVFSGVQYIYRGARILNQEEDKGIL